MNARDPMPAPEQHTERYFALTGRELDPRTVGLVAAADRGTRVAFNLGSGDHLVRLILSTHDGIEGVTGDPYRIMLNFQVDNIHAVAKRMQSAGVDFVRVPSQESWGGWIATFEDPDGNLVQLLQPTA